MKILPFSIPIYLAPILFEVQHCTIQRPGWDRIPGVLPFAIATPAGELVCTPDKTFSEGSWRVCSLSVCYWSAAFYAASNSWIITLHFLCFSAVLHPLGCPTAQGVFSKIYCFYFLRVQKLKNKTQIKTNKKHLNRDQAHVFCRVFILGSRLHRGAAHQAQEWQHCFSFKLLQKGLWCTHLENYTLQRVSEAAFPTHTRKAFTQYRLTNMGRHMIFCFNSIIFTFFSAPTAAVSAQSTEFLWSKVMHIWVCLFCYCLFHTECFVFLKQEKQSGIPPGPKSNVLAGNTSVQRAGGDTFWTWDLSLFSLETFKTLAATLTSVGSRTVPRLSS